MFKQSLRSLVIPLAIILGTAISLPASATATSDGDLEVRVWTSDEQDLPSLEQQVTHLMQQDAHSVVAHQLLSHLMVRQFTRDPSDLYVLRQAADLAQQAVDLEPDNPRGYSALADILDLMGNAERGLTLLKEAEARGIKPNWRFAFTRARLMADKSPGAAIISELNKAMKLPNSEARIVVPYVVALLQADSSGHELVKKLKSWDREFPSTLFELTSAITLTELGDVNEAHAIYKHMLANAPHDREAMVNDAISLYRDLHQGPKGIALFQRVLAEHGPSLSSDTRGMISAHLGAALLQQKKWPEARSHFVNAIAEAPGASSLIDFMARAYRTAKQPQQLVLTLHQLNDTVRGTSILHALLGETLSEQLAKHDDAVHAFADALVLDPDRSDYYNGMGLALYRNKSYSDALKAFALATEVDPNDATARYNEACVLAVVGRNEEALSLLTEAISIDPRLMATAKADSDFASLKASARFNTLVQGASTEAEDANFLAH